MKISGSSENGCDHEQALSRTAKLVLKATESSPKHTLKLAQPKRGLFSEHLAKKHGLPFETEVNNFLSTLKILPQDLDTVTIAELRHKFEKRKHRKLTAQEKATFLGLCQNFICDMFETKHNGSAGLVQSEVGSRLGNGTTHESSDALSPNSSREQPHQSHRLENKVDGPYKTPPNKKLLFCDKAGGLTPGSNKKRRSGEEVNFDLDVSGLMGEDELVSRCDLTAAGKEHLENSDCKFIQNVDEKDTFFAKSKNNSKGLANNNSSKHNSATSPHNSILNSGTKKLKKNKDKYPVGTILDSSVDLQELPLTGSSKECWITPKKMQHKATDKNNTKNKFTRATAASGQTKTENITKQSREAKKGQKPQEKNRKSNSNDTDVSLCDKCFAMISKEEKGIHHLFCNPTSPQPQMGENVHDELLIDDTVDYAECPICLERFPCDILPVHASECGL